MGVKGLVYEISKTGSRPWFDLHSMYNLHLLSPYPHRLRMIEDAGDSRITLLCEYLARSVHPVVVLSVCRQQHDDGVTCRKAPVLVFRNEAFPTSEEHHALMLAEPWSCGRGRSAPPNPSEIEAERVRGSGEGSSEWHWTIRTLLDDSLLVVEGHALLNQLHSASQHTGPPTQTNRPSVAPPTLILPTPAHPKPFPGGPELDLTAYPPAALDHNALFLSRPWASSPLGPIDSWSAQLRGVVQIMMASPFPVLISYGPEYVLLYNEPYSKVIGRKHPTILGMKYGEAWPEVWGVLEPVIRVAYQGSILNVDCQEMFLMRGVRLEETYFSYSLIPIRDADNLTCGLYIPNFDNTVRIVTERRIRSLHEISRCINRSLTQERVVQDALKGMEDSNSRDLNFAMFYIAESADQETWLGGSDGVVKGGISEGDRSSNTGSRGSIAQHRHRKKSRSLRSDSITSSVGQSTSVQFRLIGSYGIDTHPASNDVPLEFLSTTNDDDTEATPTHSITRLVRQARNQDVAVFLPDLAELPSLAALVKNNTFGDPPGAAIVLPIRSSAEDRLHGVMLLGLSTRLPWDEEYSNYVELVKGLVATGLATIKLHEEDLARARYMAALNRQKNEELQSLLAHRTMELKNSELKFRSAFAACPAAIWIGSPEGHLWDINQAYYKLSGLPIASPLDDWIHRVHPDDLDHVLAVYKHCKTKTVASEFRFIPTDAEVAAGLTERWVEASGGPVFDDNGKIVMTSGALLDITQRRQHLMSQTKRANDALELKQLQDHFIDMLSHELRNPLSAICLSSDGVVDSLRILAPRCSPEIAEELLDIVNDAGVMRLCTVHMRRLVDDVLALSKLDNNILVITPTLSHPESTCLEVMEMVQSEMLAHDIVAEFHVKQGYRDSGVEWAELDPARVKQVIMNLLVNAIKFTTAADRRVITLTLDAAGSRPRLPGEPLNEQSSRRSSANGDETGRVYLIFEVSDTGIGMMEEEIQRVFKRFAQGSNRTHLTYGGSGLGLFICRRIVQLLGGEISVRSKPTEGSTFAFFFPVPLAFTSAHSNISSLPMQNPSSSNNQILVHPGITSPKPNSSAWPRPRRASSNLDVGGTHVLLVEDNEISQKLLKKQLVRAGFTVATANDGIEAIEFMLRDAARYGGSMESPRSGGARVRLILMDIEMPRKGGIEATRDIRALEADGTLPYRTPIIAVSANVRAGQVQSMIDAEMDDVVNKPFKMADLLLKIEAVTGRSPHKGHAGKS